MTQIQRLELLLLIMFIVISIALAMNDKGQTAWTDTEYETNRQCAYLRGTELDKCKLYFNIN